MVVWIPTQTVHIVGSVATSAQRGRAAMLGVVAVREGGSNVEGAVSMYKPMQVIVVDVAVFVPKARCALEDVVPRAAQIAHRKSAQVAVLIHRPTSLTVGSVAMPVWVARSVRAESVFVRRVSRCVTDVAWISIPTHCTAKNATNVVLLVPCAAVGVV